MMNHGSALEVDPKIPEPVVEVARRLADRGHKTWLSGEDLHRRLRGLGASTPMLLTSAPSGSILATFERAVPIRPDATVVMLPTPAGPIDVIACCPAEGIDGHLRSHDFTIHAAAYDPLSGELRDPTDGQADWRRRILRCPGRASERLAEAPERALRALRCVSDYAMEADSDLEAALAGVAGGLRPCHALAVRREIFRWLDLDDPRPGARLAWSSGLTAALAPDARSGGAELLATVRVSPESRRALRLAIWLRGSSASALLRTVRMGEPLSSTVLRLLELHPIEQSVRPSNEASVARLERRCGKDEIDTLIAWRRCEIAAGTADQGAAQRLADLTTALERTALHRERKRQRRALAIDGASVMAILGSGPGPAVGRALAALADWVGDDSSRNDLALLCETLRAWQREGHPDLLVESR